MIYNIEDKIPFKFLTIYAVQQLLSVIVATILIANICGTPVDACLFGACVGTLIYQFFTKFKSPMFISSCGATCSAVIGALAISKTQNYFLVVIGGFTILAIYTIMAILIKKKGKQLIDKIFTPSIVGAITIVIGLNLASFIPTYTSINGGHSNLGIIIAIIVAIIVAVVSYYATGFLKTIPFLIGLLGGYIISIILTQLNIVQLIDFNAFNNLTIFNVPDFTFKYWSFDFNAADILNVVLMFAPVAICSFAEHLSDHQVLSNIIDRDLIKEPGLHRTLIGDGVASLWGTIVCGLPNTSYGEAIATTGFSQVASVKVMSLAAAFLGILSFIMPFQAFVTTIPACVFGGCAMILYGYISASGLRTLINNKVNLWDSKNLIIISVILTIGVSGIFLFSEALTGVSLAMVVGIILNLILKGNNYGK